MSFCKFLLLLMVMMFIFLYNTKTHFMVALLLMETIMLSALVMSIFMFSLSQFEPFIFLLLLTFAVCEAALGLSLLLTYIKVTGSDMINSMKF
uniref:NADH-ubiquinone oxidoreductase chain 4L n=1 Tax=Stereophaedusa neniopsis TaxID=1885807 RepID=A0A224A243_9EUPU|nr:NADH dehydrogenase subunit 4L [Stereophaedusa neniopsis]BBA10850.1 NADH dehydrogenase subunit 4L [Stereophaedusa neniopsis]